jgi:GT2 family glycosyltransferase
MKTLIGIVSYGNLPFLQLAVRGIKETLTKDADILVVIADPKDFNMEHWLSAGMINHIRNTENIGFAGSINDIFEYAWVKGDYDNVIIMGNDVIPYPGALDAMINCAETTDWEWICASQFDSKSLVARYPEAAQYFKGDTLEFTNFDARPWEMHRDFHAPHIEADSLKDVRNLALFKRSVFDKTGYADVNFWPNAYFEDNDAARRANLCGVKACGLSEAAYFHFWSRTIHQGENRQHSKFFERNLSHYIHKWGGAVGGESYSQPFDGRGFQLSPEIFFAPDMRIASREQEQAIIRYWSTL